MRVRLKDVAAKAGVAVNTASTILNRRPNSWASKETEERVFQAAADLGYRPNRAAVGLRYGRFNTIALLVADLHNPYYTTFADLLELEAERHGYDVLIESWRTDLAREKHCLEYIMDRQVDGVAAFFSDAEAHRPFLEQQAKAGRPFVGMAFSGGEPLPVDSVVVDFEGGLRGAVDTLYRDGHRRFAFISALSGGQESGSRPELFRRLLAEKGLGRFESVSCGHGIESALEAAASLLKCSSSSRPTALIALNDLSAIGAMRAATQAGLSVPRDLSVIGVDDIPLAQFLPIALSTIAQPLAEMARETMNFLVDRIERERTQGPRQACFGTLFIPRESNGIAPQ
jgi:LacI family transcriptional regulator